MISFSYLNKKRKGTVASNTVLFWLPQSFVDKHWVFPYNQTKETIENEGGMIIKTNSKVNQVSACYGCKECNIIVVTP